MLYLLFHVKTFISALMKAIASYIKFSAISLHFSLSSKEK